MVESQSSRGNCSFIVSAPIMSPGTTRQTRHLFSPTIKGDRGEGRIYSGLFRDELSQTASCYGVQEPIRTRSLRFNQDNQGFSRLKSSIYRADVSRNRVVVRVQSVTKRTPDTEAAEDCTMMAALIRAAKQRYQEGLVIPQADRS